MEPGADDTMHEKRAKTKAEEPAAKKTRARSYKVSTNSSVEVRVSPFGE